MALVLAIEPDLRQAAILKRIVREQVKADVVVVDSRDAALDAIRSAVPDVMLLSALLSPRDEDELVARLRSLEGAEHLQTHTIPQLASSLADKEEGGGGRGFLKAFRRKKAPAAPVAGCDPELFAEEIRTFLRQAEERKRERQEERLYNDDRETLASELSRKEHAAPLGNEAPAVEATPAAQSWDSPFTWRRDETYVPPQEPVETSDGINAAAAEPESIASAPVDAEPVAEPALAEPLDEPQPVFSAAAEEILYPTASAIETVLQPQADETTVVDAVSPIEPLVISTSSEEPDYAAEVAMSSFATPEAFGAQDAVHVADESTPEFEVVVPIESASAFKQPVVELAASVPDEPAIDLSIDLSAASAVAESDETFGSFESATEAPAHLVEAATEEVQVEAAIADQARALAATETGGATGAHAIRDTQRLGPLATWARIELPKSLDADAPAGSDMRALIARLAVPPHVAGVTYASGVRIRRVRVPAQRTRKPAGKTEGPVILSRRALEAQRTAASL